MISADELVKTVQAAIPGAEVMAMDMGGGDHWNVVVVAKAFEGKPLIEQHKMVQLALRERMEGFGDGSIHALKLKTMTPAQAGRK